MLRRNKTYRVNVFEAALRELQEKLHFFDSGYEFRKPLPRIAGTFDQFHGVGQKRILIFENSFLENSGLQNSCFKFFHFRI